MSELSGSITDNPNTPCEAFSALAVRCPEGKEHPIPHAIADNYRQHGPQLSDGQPVQFGLEDGQVTFVRTAPRPRCTSHIPC